MIYDRDLRTARRWAFVLGFCNVLATGVHLYEHNWTVASGSALWGLCCVLWLGVIHSQQKTRDIGRVIEAGLHGMREEIERDLR